MRYVTLDEAITYFDEQIPNQYSREEKIRWISELDERIYEDIIKPRLPLFRPVFTVTNTGTVTVFLTLFDYNALLGTAGQTFSQAQIGTFVTFAAVTEDLNKEFGRYNFGGYDEETNGETVLLVPSMFKDIYKYWIEKNVDINNREIGAANNAIANFQSIYEDYYAWYNRYNIVTKNKRIIF